MKEVFSCENCGNHGNVVYKEQETRFPVEVLFCPFCGADLDIEETEEEDWEDDE